MKEKIILDLFRFVLISIIIAAITYFIYPMVRYEYIYDYENTGSFDSASGSERLYRVDNFNEEIQMLVLRGEDRGTWIPVTK